MKIEVIPVNASGQVRSDETQVVQFKVTGPIDSSDAVLKRARELVAKTGSDSMKRSFEWALATGVYASDK